MGSFSVKMQKVIRLRKSWYLHLSFTKGFWCPMFKTGLRKSPQLFSYESSQ